jgi:hypothetical protein
MVLIVDLPPPYSPIPAPPDPCPIIFPHLLLTIKIDKGNTKMVIISFCSDNVAQDWCKKKRVIKG